MNQKNSGMDLPLNELTGVCTECGKTVPLGEMRLRPETERALRSYARRETSLHLPDPFTLLCPACFAALYGVKGGEAGSQGG